MGLAPVGFSLLLLVTLLFSILPANALLEASKSPLNSTFTHLNSRAGSVWDQFVTKGRKMHCAMQVDQATAQQEIGNGASTPWTNYGDLTRYGWVLSNDHDPWNSLAQFVLSDTFSRLSINEEANELYIMRHLREMVVNDVKYIPSGGHYDSLFNLDDGLLVAESNSSPENEQHDWKEEQYPPLRKWSDVISLLWIDAAGSKAANLKHVIRSVVTNRETLSVMRRAVGEGEFDEKFQDWGKFDPIDTNGRTFRPSEDAFYALLYTPNGRGIGWSLIQHKAQLGIKTVSEITVFGANDSPMLYFKIDDVSLMDQVQG